MIADTRKIANHTIGVRQCSTPTLYISMNYLCVHHRSNIDHEEDIIQQILTKLKKNQQVFFNL